MAQDGILPFSDAAVADTDDGAHQAVTETTVSGEIMRIVFESDDGQYVVLRLLTSSNRELTLVGPMHGMLEGQDIEARGRWETHSRHGRQFRVTQYRALLPSSEKGIRRYLASGLIPGIGPKLADRIVERFGTDALNVLDHYPKRLTDIPGLGKKRVDMINKAWKEHSRQRDTYIFLQGLGLGPSYCAKIFNAYGAGAAETVRRNPYQLATDIHGIGFTMADRIARELGINPESPVRLAAGIVYALQKLAEDGHACYPRTKLTAYPAELLQVDAAAAKIGLQQAIIDGRVVEEAASPALPEQFVYSFRLHAAEASLAQSIQRLLACPVRADTADIRLSGQEYELLNAKQKHAVRGAFQSWISIITGGPGVGKTTVTGRIVNTARRLGRRVFLAAPTGRAAKRMTESCGTAAKTIHRMLKWDPRKRSFVYGADRPVPCDVLILDEVSMLDIELASQLFAAIKTGTHVVLVGDRDQLPSVGPGAVLNDLIACGRIPVTHLTEIYRQAEGSRIVRNAHAINRGDFPDLRTPPRDITADFYWIEQEEAEQVEQIIARLVTKRIPQRFRFNPMTDIQVLAPMNRGSCGTLALNSLLQQRLNPGPAPEFRVGERILRINDRIMQTVNNYDKGVFNGELGQIIHVDAKRKTFKVMFDEGTVDYDWNEADQVRLAYAVTVHKAQGSEFPVVILPVLTRHFVMLQRNLIYTGMTRARRLLIMIGTRKALAIAVRNDKPAFRYTGLAARLSRDRDTL
ncbi:MAG: ATP-dependent RecD-like DNA helicase [Candidatus Pacebacteria bacterium]|nr:ATP-dependent RecD-like DNA helicase [Candidatus Paceibacterota bacterium]